MSATTRTQRPPVGVRLLSKLRKEPDTVEMSSDELIAYAAAQNRTAESGWARLITGFPNRKATVAWQRLNLPDRALPVRVYRPRRDDSTAATGLPLIVHVHGGGFHGTAVQCDWINSHLAARLPAVVVSVEHRLITAEIPLSAAIEDCCDALHHVVGNATTWGIDPDRVAVAGESAGATMAAMVAIRARHSRSPLRAQVLVNPCLDLTFTTFDYPSMGEHANSPTLSTTRIEMFRRLAVPEGTDASAVSPLSETDHSELPPALIVVPTLDPLADQGRAYHERLRAAETPVRLSEHPRAGHAFLTMPGLVPRAKVARDQITNFLGQHLAASPAKHREGKAR